VIRDKRGYETTYLMHWCREGTKQKSRILYVFRTPGGMRVGREALDSDVLKQIEAEHPGIEFDWNAVFHNQQVIETASEPRRPRKRPSGPSGEAPAAAEAPPAQPPPLPRFTVPATIEGATPDEQIAFLGRWYAALREKIPQRAPDPARQEVLFALAERLNPAAWTDADQITAGLQNAAEALQRLAHVFAKRRRRSKKKGGAARPDAHAATAVADLMPEADEPSTLSEPAEPSEAFEPAEQMELAESFEPSESAAPTEPTEPTEPSEPPESSEPPEPSEP
jgi:hypothetical protein